MNSMPAGEIIDILLRGMTSGALLLLAIGFAARGPGTWRRWFGAAFAAATSCYLIVTSNEIARAIGWAFAPAQVLSISAPVLFWWFSLALFDDRFRWRWPLLAPFLLILPAMAAHMITGRAGPYWTAALFLLQATMLFVYGHAMWAALRNLNDDLVEGRRRFRIVFSIVIAVTGLIITYVEATTNFATPPLALRLFQASAILLLTFSFGAWLTATRAELLDGPAVPAGAAPIHNAPASTVRAADRPAFETLTRLMDEGVYREEGLTVAGLAAKVGVPEHQLRALINGQLGHRNFSAFLNARRIEDAKAALADAGQARRQILQIALDLGYGSIAPFNRAFKEATGQTPTEYRKRALGG
jgi:AraC-like DNA-binding protein